MEVSQTLASRTYYKAMNIGGPPIKKKQADITHEKDYNSP